MSSSESSFAPDEFSESESDFSVNEQPQQPRSRRSSSRIEVVDSSSDDDNKDGILTYPDLDSDLEPSPDTNVRDNQFETLHGHLQRVSPKILETYASLVTEIENDINYSTVKEDEEIHNVHQHGAVIWTATEKEILYKVLDRKGKNGIKEIAAAIGTKSELEVMDHLRLLHRGLESQHLIERHVKTIIMGDIPAAAEISEKCCAELDEYARGLRAKDELAAILAARMRFGDNWNVTSTQAKQLLAAEMDVPMRGDMHLPANLFNIPTWIDLEQRFFMNFGGSQEEDNWVNIAQAKHEYPSISGDALMDFYALTVSITRRLIQSIQFVAMSRIRSQRLYGRERANAVRRKDVKAAVNILNMKPKRTNFLLNLARRNELVVKDEHKRKGWKAPTIDYDEAEKILNGETDYFQRVRDATSAIAADHDKAEEALKEDGVDTDVSDEEDSHRPSRMASRQPTELSSPNVSSDEDEISLDSEEEHADTLDREHSHREELALWHILEKPAPPRFETPITTDQVEKDASRRPTAERKAPQDMIQWRDRTLYRSEWEEYGYEVGDVAEALVENRRKRRRVEEPLSASVVHSEDDDDKGGEGGLPQLGAEEHTRVEPPRYGSAGWDAFLHSFLTPGQAQPAEQPAMSNKNTKSRRR
jgi:hypothetical protein